MENLLQKIQTIPRDHFSTADVRKVSNMRAGSLRVSLARLAKEGSIVRLSRGWYTADSTKVDFERLALSLSPGSALSCEWVLAQNGILSQQPTALTLVTTGQGKKKLVGGKMFAYRHIQPRLFWGYRKTGRVLIADSEKAFLDLAYLSLNGYAAFDPEEMNLNRLEKNKIRMYLKKIGSKKLNALIEKSFPIREE